MATYLMEDGDGIQPQHVETPEPTQKAESDDASKLDEMDRKLDAILKALGGDR